MTRSSVARRQQVVDRVAEQLAELDVGRALKGVVGRKEHDEERS